MIRLLCSVSSDNPLFQDLYREVEAWDGADIYSDDTSGTLDFEVSNDEFTVAVVDKSNKTVASFSAYYIEEDDYGDPVYDIYINDSSTSENASSADVEDEFRQWFKNLRESVGAFDEETEMEYLDTGNINPASKFLYGLEKLKLLYAERAGLSAVDLENLDLEFLDDCSGVEEELATLVDTYIQEAVVPSVVRDLESTSMGGLFRYKEWEAEKEESDFLYYTFYFEFLDVDHYATENLGSVFFYTLCNHPDDVEGATEYAAQGMFISIERVMGNSLEYYLKDVLQEVEVIDVSIDFNPKPRLCVMIPLEIEIPQSEIVYTQDIGREDLFSVDMECVDLSTSSSAHDLYLYLNEKFSSMGWRLDKYSVLGRNYGRSVMWIYAYIS